MGNLENQKKELASLRITAKEARKACENTRKQRSTLEAEIMSDKSIRDKKLTAIKRNLREIQDEAENLNLAPLINRKKNNRAGQNTEGSGRMTNFSNDRRVQKDALSAALHILKDTVGASKVEDIATNFESQLQTQQNLLNEAETLQKSREDLAIRLHNEEESLKTSTYDASIALESIGNTDDLKVDDRISLARARVLEDQVNCLDSNIRKIVSAINVYYRKASILKGTSCNEDLPYDSKMKVILEQFSLLSKRQQDRLIQEESHDLRRVSLVPKDDSNIENLQFDLLLAKDNRRIVMPEINEDGNTTIGGNNGGDQRATEKQSLFNDEDEEIEAGYYSREQMKKKAEEIMALARPKKGRK